MYLHYVGYLSLIGQSVSILQISIFSLIYNLTGITFNIQLVYLLIHLS